MKYAPLLFATFLALAMPTSAADSDAQWHAALLLSRKGEAMELTPLRISHEKHAQAATETPRLVFPAPFLIGENRTHAALLSTQEEGESLLALVEKESGEVVHEKRLSEYVAAELGVLRRGIVLDGATASFLGAFPRRPTLLRLSLEEGTLRRITMPREAEGATLTGDGDGVLAAFYKGAEGVWLLEKGREEFLPLPPAFAHGAERLAFPVAAPSQEGKELIAVDARFIAGYGLALLTADGALHHLWGGPSSVLPRQPLQIPGGGKGIRLLLPLADEREGAYVALLCEEGEEGRLVAHFFDLAEQKIRPDLRLPLPRNVEAEAFYAVDRDGGVFAYIASQRQLVRLSASGEEVLYTSPEGDATPFSMDCLLWLRARR